MRIITAFLTLWSAQICAQPSNPFTLNEEGWSAICEGACPVPAANWLAINGNPNGCYKGTDNSTGSWYYYSSAIYNTDLSSFYGSYINFDLKQNTNTFQTNEPDVIICKLDGSLIVYSTAFNPGTSWTTFSVPLMETGWRHTTLAGAVVTSAEMISFLSNVYYIKIRGDYSSITTETDWLDNVYITPAMVLPIELITFSGIEESAGIAQLSWQTLSEESGNYFQIEKSVNQAISFDSIGIIASQGTGTAGTMYQFNDLNFYADAYYRLKSVDDNNVSNYSDIILIKNDAEKSQINIFPNPASSHIILQNNSGEAINGPIQVLDVNKNIVQVNNNISISSPVIMDVSQLPNGSYFISLLNNTDHSAYGFQVIH